MIRIIDRKEIAPNVHECTVEAPDIARKVMEGQFIIAIPDEYSERTPITVADWDAEAGTITFIFLGISFRHWLHDSAVSGLDPDSF